MPRTIAPHLSQETSLKTKVNDVCNAFLEVLRLQAIHMQSVITAHVCKSPPDITGGLQIISQLKGIIKNHKLYVTDHISLRRRRAS
jgi:hypothetical protein